MVVGPPRGVAERSLVWEKQVKVSKLNNNQIHLWLVPLSQLQVSFSEGICQGLSERELIRASKILNIEKRRLYCGGRIALRMLLEGYTGINRDVLEFQYGERGKPTLDTTLDNGNMEFNYTVSSGYALFGFSWNNPIGVDIEIHPRKIDYDHFSRRILGVEETKEWGLIEDHRRNNAMLACWTRKESYGKLMGVGIRYEMSKAELFVGLENDSWISAVDGLFETDSNPEQGRVAGVQIGLPLEGAAAVMYGWSEKSSQPLSETGNSHPELLGFMYSPD
jgi:4'-phosphopantetheinyl transferase